MAEIIDKVIAENKLAVCVDIGALCAIVKTMEERNGNGHKD